MADSLSLTSRRVYYRTFRAWCRFADGRDISTDDVSYLHVREFLNEASLAKTTRQNRLSHMRKVLEALTVADRERYEQHYPAVKSFLKVRTTDDDRMRPGRVKRALKPHEVTRLLDVWRNERSVKGVRKFAWILQHENLTFTSIIVIFLLMDGFRRPALYLKTSPSPERFALATTAIAATAAMAHRLGLCVFLLTQ